MHKKKKFVLSIVIIFFLCHFIFSEEHIKIFYKQINEKEYAFYADNSNYCPYQILVTPELIDGITSDANIPYYAIIQPQEQAVYLFSIFTKNNTTDLKIKYRLDSSLGDPRIYKYDKDYGYIVPYEENTELMVSQGYNGRFSHRGWTRFSLDFGMNIGTPICAARDGVVVAVKQDSNIGGKSYRYRNYANYIIIYHKDGTFAQYMHIKKDGSLVNVGDKVKAGDLICYSGNTGWSRGPHLHFMVFHPEYLFYDTIPTLFFGENGTMVHLESRKVYFSFHNKIDKNRNIEVTKTKSNGDAEVSEGGY